MLLFYICGYTVFCNILLLVTHVLKFLILISVQCLFFFFKTEVMNTLIANMKVSH